VRNDLFVAHESIYRFAAGLAAGRRVVDAACGTGYGSAILARAGAARVVGVDLDRRRLAYARRRFRRPDLRFERQDCAALDFPPGEVDLVVSSNTLEHLERPEPFLRAAGRALAPGGEILVAVPPVLSEADLAVHRDNPHHRSPLSVRAWAELFERGGWGWSFFCHRCTRPLDFRSPFRSRVALEDFSFEPAPLDAAYERPPITAVYLLRRAEVP
jgi:SAM-dependent methyltransferase